MKQSEHFISRIMMPVKIMPIAALALSSSVVFAQDLASPDSLSYEVYSRTTAELFWQRSDMPGLSYEVLRDGQLLATTDGVSFVDKSLSRGPTYTYEIIAVDADGVRSAPSSVSFSLGESDSGSVEPAPETPVEFGAPTGLRADIYSSRSAEIFWDRSSQFGLTYDVSKDGSLLETTNGVSYFARNLASGQEHTFQVVAVDLEGNQSAPSVVTFTMPGSSTPTTPGPVDDDPLAGSVSAPTGVRASVYSSRSAEIFWDRATTPGLSYELSRDNVPLTTTDGVSFYDDELSPGSTYLFELVAINSAGNRSTPASITVSTSGGSVPVSPSNNETAAAIQEPDGYFDQNGYGTVDVVRLDVRTVTTPGVCTADDESGCTLDDVKADIDGNDDFTVDIAIHFQGDDLPDDGSINNAELRQRGGFTRLAPQKSFRIKLDSKDELWRGERRLQLNKMPYDQSRIRNKLSFDLMQDIPHLPSLKTQFVNLWIDDGAGPEDYGLFTHAEYVGKEYLVNRGWDSDNNIYKIEEFVFALSDLEYLAVDSDGAPLDDDRFETRLDPKRGDDHRKVIEMIQAVNDNERSFDSILEQYFDKDNVLAWVTVNFLLHQMDAVTHNFYLYNPVGTDKFYFLPWDYDGTFAVEQKPANSLETSELFRRLYYGFSKGRASNFLNRYYRQPGIYQQIVARANELRNNYLTDSTISDLARQYSEVISEYAGRMPDIEHNFAYDKSNSRDFASHVAENHAVLLNYGIPFPPKLRDVEQSGDSLRFRWRAAHDMAGNSLSYELEISSSPEFGSDDQLLSLTGLSESDGDGYFIDASQIGSGTRYARLIARSSSNPDEFWQIASNRPVIDGEMRVGVVEFTSP